jgi:DNA-binding MarR family transcriptional regulator
MEVPSDLPAPSSEVLGLVLDADIRLWSLSERLRQHWSSHAAAIGLSVAQVKVLSSLKPGGSIPMRALAARLDADASNLTALVDRLEWRGAVVRRLDPSDRRIKSLVLTTEGERLRATFWHNLAEDPGPLAPLDESKLRSLAEILDALGADDECIAKTDSGLQRSGTST